MAQHPAPTSLRSASNRQRRGPQHGVLLREMLLRRRGWCALRSGGGSITVGRRRYLLTPLAMGEGWKVLLAERPGQRDLPEYLARQVIHQCVARESGPTLTIFTDAAGTRRVWGWTRRRALVADVYLEEHRSGEDEEDWLPPDAPAPGCCDACDPALLREGAELAAAALLRRLRACRSLAPASRRRALPPAAQLVKTVAGSRQPAVVRRVWRELERTRVLDPDCGRGDWLLGCYEALVTVGLACLERMRAWIEALPPGGGRRRADAFSDFQRLISRAGEMGMEGVRERLIGEVVLLRCLRGVAANAADAAATRILLAGRLGGPASGPELTKLVRVEVGRAAGGAGWAAAVTANAGRSPPDLPRRGERVGGLDSADLLARAEEQVIRMRLRLGGSLEDLLEGIEELRVRRARMAPLPCTADEKAAICARPFTTSAGCRGAGAYDLVRGPAAPDR